METIANMKSQFIRVSWGIVRIDSVEVYTELWLSTILMSLKVKFKAPKGMSYSYTCSTKDAPFEDGSFLSYWIPKSVYFPIHFCGATINELTEIVVKHLNLRFFEESRKWLTKDEKSVAHMLAVESIGILDAEQLLKCDVSDLPQVFHEEVSAFRNEYYEYLRRKDYALYKSLNTYEGLTECLRMAKNSGDKPAVTWFNQLIWELTELWEK